MLLLTLLLGAALTATATAADPKPPPAGQSARAFLATMAPSRALQDELERTVKELRRRDRGLSRAQVAVALIDLAARDRPVYAHVNGHRPIYPASVVKLVYLLAAYRWQELGRLVISAELAAALKEMIRVSSNTATQTVFAALTETTSGPELSPAEYKSFRLRRMAVKQWLESLGIDDLHCVHPTYNSEAEISGRERQFLRDRSVHGALPTQRGEYRNRQAMTALGTAKVLALLSAGHLLSPTSSAEALALLRRSTAEQPYLLYRIAGGSERVGGLEAFTKTGTWGPIFADAGIVRPAPGKGQGELIVSVFIERPSGYHGSFVADLTERLARGLLRPDGGKEPDRR